VDNWPEAQPDGHGTEYHQNDYEDDDVASDLWQ
jgi:hypothetical protein